MRLMEYKNPQRIKFMKKIVQYVLVVALAVFGMACDKEEELVKETGRVTFSFSKQEISGGRTRTNGTPSSIVLNVENASGQTVLENKKLQLLGFGDNYVTENIVLEVGNYKITSFIVLNEINNAIYATPKAGSPKAEFVSTPLPIAFSVSEGNSSSLRPEVLEVESTDSPEHFGYASFGFEIVTGDKLNVRVRVELRVGEILYQDVDTKVKITAFNSDNQPQWMQEYSYVGPVTNLFSVRKGYHHYEFTINHWGITDRQIVSGQQLIESMQEPLPTTFILGGSKAAKKIAYYVSYIERPDPAEWGKTYLEPQTTVEYLYRTDGKVDKMKIYGYVDSLKTFKEQRYFQFEYADGKVSKLSGYHLGQVAPYLEDIYTYTNGKVSKIQEVNYAAAITTDLTIAYFETQQLVNAVYASSNGSSFTYQFDYVNKNITSDVTSRFGSLCSTGNYTRDKNINPFAHLGYTDFVFRNVSINNKIAENVNYTGCAFPTLIPEAYVYKYDFDGYPLEEKTVYKSSNLVMTTQYYYQ
jgi:hypothetical protein